MNWIKKSYTTETPMFRSDIYRIYSMYEISLIENIFRQNNIDPIWYTSTLSQFYRTNILAIN